jgi:hypothetical protein
MKKSMLLGVFMLCLTAVMGAGVASARTMGNSSTTHSERSAAFRVQNSNAFLLVDQNSSAGTDEHVRDSRVGSTGESGEGKYDKDHGNGNNDGDKGDQGKKYKDDPAPSPAPEPATILSLGVALMIGGGVYFLGRLRGERK